MLLSEDPAAIKPAATEFLHGDASVLISGEDAPLNGRGAPPAREQRRVDVEGVEGLKVRVEERGGDQVAERGGEEQVSGRFSRREEGVGWLAEEGGFPNVVRVTATYSRGKHSETHLPGGEEGLFGQSDSVYAELLSEDSQAG